VEQGGVTLIKELLHSDGTITALPILMAPGATDRSGASLSPSLSMRCRSIAPQEISNVLDAPREGDMLFLDIESPTDADIALLRDKFKFHALAIEDITHRGQRTKVDDYGSFAHIVLYAAEHDANHALQTYEIDLFYSDHYLVAVHYDTIAALDEAVHRWQNNTDILGIGIGALIYAVLDAVVDTYFPVLDEMEDAIGTAEERIFAAQQSNRTRNAITGDLFSLRKDLLTLRRVILPARDVMSTISRRALAHMHADIGPYVTDVYDHVIRIVDTIDTYRDLIGSAMDASLSVTSNRLNETMKTMTAGTIILAADTFIVGVYGQNFRIIPELSWTFGYAYSWALIVIVTTILAYLFRRMWWR